MKANLQELTTFIFKGPQFEDHSLEIDFLPELVNYKKLLLETAKELWRRKHPDRSRLPRGFEDSVRIKFFQLEEGSTAIRLQREVIYGDGELPFQIEDELDEAADTIENAVESILSDQGLPDEFPSSVKQYFSNWGNTLGVEDSIVLTSRRRGSPVQYSNRVRESLKELVNIDYEDIVDLFGEVRAADLDGCNFSLRLEDGKKITGKFEVDQETSITDALRDHDSVRLQIQGQAEFSAKDGSLKKITKIEKIGVLPSEGDEFDYSQKPIWEEILEIAESIPDEALSSIPDDLSKNLDYYLYGHAKDEE